MSRLSWLAQIGLAIAGAGTGLTLLHILRKATAMSVLDDPYDTTPVDPWASAETTQAGQCDPTAKSGVKLFRLWIIGQYGERAGSPQNILRDCKVGGPSEHWEGRAWDWMIPDPGVAQEMVDHLTANDCELFRRAGVMYMIYNRKMMRAYDRPGAPKGTWQPYTGPHPHTDHVHLSFSWKGARGETSLYKELEKVVGDGSKPVA